MKRLLIAPVTAALVITPGSMTAATVSAAPPAGSTASTGSISRAANETDYTQAIATLREQIPGLMDAGQIVGLSIALVDGDRTVWTNGFGWADREQKHPVTPSTMFHIGSTSKTMTVAAVMQLVEKGKVKLDAPLARYVPGFSMKQRYKHNVVTVRSVLTHHSGIPEDIPNGLFTKNKPYPGYLDHMIKDIRGIMPERRVGEAWAYSNSAIGMLQRLVEHVSGQSFEHYTRAHLFKPMGMTKSTFDDASIAGKRIATNYQALPNADGSVETIRRPREYVNVWAAGSVLSNATEMANYVKTMIARGASPTGPKILKRRTVRQMITQEPASPWDKTFFKMGLVWWLGGKVDWMGTIVNHGGDTVMHHTMVEWLPDSNLGVFVSVNTQGTADVRWQVADLALTQMYTAKTGRTAPAPPAPAGPTTVPQATLEAIAGRYTATGLGVIDIRAGDGVLHITKAAQDPGAVATTFTPQADGWYLADVASGDEIMPTTIKGTQALLIRTHGTTGLFAERLPAQTVPSAWTRRVGEYRSHGMLKNNYPAAPGVPQNRMTLSLWGGVLLLNDGHVLIPQGNKLAFTYGGTSMQVMRGDGMEVRSKGNALYVTGQRYDRVSRSTTRATSRATHELPAAPVM